jgi:hypothetical protein
VLLDQVLHRTGTEDDVVLVIDQVLVVRSYESGIEQKTTTGQKARLLFLFAKKVRLFRVRTISEQTVRTADLAIQRCSGRTRR